MVDHPMLPIKVWWDSEDGQDWTLLCSTGHEPWTEATLEDAREKAREAKLKTGSLVITDAIGEQYRESLVEADVS